MQTRFSSGDGSVTWSCSHRYLLVDLKTLNGGPVVGTLSCKWVLRGSGTTDRAATDRVIVALTLARDNSNGTSAAISRCGVTAIGTAL